MDIKKLTLEQLKALAYDQLVMVEQSQNNIKVINAEISERNKNMSEEEMEASKDEEVVEPTTPEEETE